MFFYTFLFLYVALHYQAAFVVSEINFIIFIDLVQFQIVIIINALALTFKRQFA